MFKKIISSIVMHLSSACLFFLYLSQFFFFLSLLKSLLESIRHSVWTLETNCQVHSIFNLVYT